MMQPKLFEQNRIGAIPTDDLLKESHEIVSKAIIDNDPYAIGLMLSGGDDSVTALQVATMLGIKIDFVLHGVTGTGLPIVRKFVHEFVASKNLYLIEANAGTAFEERVKRRGFFGRGKDAHKFAYHILKSGPFESALSKNIIKRKRGRKIILLNGVRVEESENRLDNFGDNPYRIRKNAIWVNIIHWFTKNDCLQLLEAENIQRNPASIKLNRSGECNCGTMQSMADIDAACEFDKEFAGWITTLRKYAVEKFGWDVWQSPTRDAIAEMKAVTDTLTEDMPMCVGCKARIQYRLFNE